MFYGEITWAFSSEFLFLPGSLNSLLLLDVQIVMGILYALAMMQGLSQRVGSALMCLGTFLKPFLLGRGKGGTVNSRFKKDLNLQIHLHKALFSDDQFLDSYHKSFLNQTTLDLRKEKWSFLNREFTVL